MESSSSNPLFSFILLDDVDSGSGGQSQDQVDGHLLSSNSRPYIVYTNSIEDLRNLPSEDENTESQEIIFMTQSAGAMAETRPVSAGSSKASTLPKSSHLLLVNHEWGYHEGSGRLTGYLAFTTLEGSVEDESKRMQILKTLGGSGINCSIVRWKGNQMILSFQSSDVLKDCFNKLKAERIPVPISQIYTAYQAESTYPCYLHISVSPSSVFSEVSADIEKALISRYSGNMFVHVAESTSISSDSAAAISGIPRLAVILHLHTALSQTPLKLERMTKLLAEKNWCKIERHYHAIESTSLYKHSMLDGVAFGLHPSALSEGVQFVVTVSDPSKFDEMVTFYRRVLHVEGVRRTTSETGKCTLPLDPNSELIVRYDKSLEVSQACDSVGFSLRPESLDHLQLPDQRIDCTGWKQLLDPEGNKLHLLTPIK